LQPSPIATDVVAHSPTPSIVSTTAFSNGEGKNALAAWLKWCLLNSSSRFHPSRLSSRFNSLRSRLLRNNFSHSHSGIDIRKDLNQIGRASCRERVMISVV